MKHTWLSIIYKVGSLTEVLLFKSVAFLCADDWNAYVYANEFITYIKHVNRYTQQQFLISY